MGDFFINISRFEDILNLKYMVLCFIIIKHTISYEFITFTHTMMIGQLRTSYTLNMHIYITLNTD